MEKTAARDTNKLAAAPLGPLLLELAIPTVFAQIVNLLYNLVDRIYVGRIPGTGSLALAGLGVAFPVILLISAFAQLVGMGGAPRAAIHMGKKENDKAEQILGSSIVFLTAMALVLSVFFMATKEQILMMFGASEQLMPYADSYLTIYLVGTLAVQLALGLNQFISCQGFAKTSMITVLVGAVINIVLDPIMIYGFGMGVQGAALATIISQAVSAVWVVAFLFGKRSILRVRREYLKIDWRVLAPVLSLGLAPFIMQATECLVQLTFNTGMQKYGNDYYVGAMTIMFSVSQMLFLPMQGLSQGSTPIISYNFGAGNTERVRKAFFLTLTFAFLFSFICTGIILLFPRPFVGLFSQDPEIIRIGSYGIRIYAFGFLFMGIQNACQQTFLSLGQAKISMFLAMLRKVILVIPLAIIFPMIRGWGTDGLFYAEPVADLIAITTTAVMFGLNFRKILAHGAR